MDREGSPDAGTHEQWSEESKGVGRGDIWDPDSLGKGMASSNALTEEWDVCLG